MTPILRCCGCYIKAVNMTAVIVRLVYARKLNRIVLNYYIRRLNDLTVFVELTQISCQTMSEIS